MASERLQVILQLVAGQYKSEARQAASATSEVARQAQSAGGSIGQLDAGLRAVAQKMGLTEAEARDLATQMSRGVKESNQLYGELVALGKQMGLTDREARQFARSMQRSTTEVDKAGGIFKRVKGEIAGLGTTAKVALGTVLAQAVGNFFRGAAQAATDLNESGNAIRVVFGEAASTIEAFGQVSAQATGLATSTFQQMAAQTGQLLQGMGLSAQEAAEWTVTLTQRSADLASVMNTDVDEALFAVQSALRGETEPIRRFIGSFSQAEVQAYALEKGIIASKDAFVGEAKALATLQFIMDKTNRVAGDFVKTSQETANAQRVAAAEFENAQARLGQSLQGPLAFGANLAADILQGLQVMGLFGGTAKDATIESIRMSEAIDHIIEASREGRDPLAALADSMLHLANSGELTSEEFQALAASAGLSQDQFDEFATEVIRQAEEMGLAPEIIEELRDAMEGAGGAAADAEPEIAAADKAMLNMAQRGDAADVLARMKAEAESAVPDLQDFAEAVRDIRNALLEATDPAFAAISAQLRADEAIAKADEAKKAWENGEGTAEDYYQAVSDAAEAVLAADAANADLGANAPRHLRTVQSAFDEVTEAIDEPRIQVRELLEDLQIIDSMGTIQFRIDLDMDPADRALIEGVASGRLRGPKPAPRTRDDRSPALRQHGGPVGPGQLVRVGEGNQPELYLIPGERGHVFSQSQAMRLMQGLGGGDNVTINLYGSGIAEPDIGLLVAMAGVRRRVETRRRL